jgi:hypothetical protein
MDINVSDLNKLFCTFTKKEEVEDTIKEIDKRYSVLYKKVFVLESIHSDELICTYNIDSGNINNILPNTILMHRKKESNTLYTINALNALIISLNGGRMDKTFLVPWSSYKNCILLTQENGVRKLDTTINKVINLN